MSTHNKRPYPFNGCLHPAFLPLALFLGVYLFRSVSAPYSDFAGYYYGGRELLAGHFGNTYDMERLNGLILGDGYRDVMVSYAPFPPFTSLVFAPFLGFSMPMAKLAFDIACCLIFLITLMRARVFLNISPFMVLVLPVIFYVPMVNNLYFGQSYLLLCSLLLEGYMAYKKGKTFLSSLWWGIAIMFKVFPGILLIWLLLQKKYRAAAGLCVACGGLLGLSLLLNGWAVWKYYVFEILPKVNNGELNDSFAFLFQSAFMFLKRLFVYDGLLNPHPAVNSPVLFGVLIGVFKAMVLTFCIRFTLRHKDRDYASFAVWIVASMLISPNGSSYSLVLLVIPFFAVRRSPVLAGLVLFLICNIPVYRLGDVPVWEQFPRLYLMLIFFILLLRPLRVAWHMGLWGALTLFFLGLFFIGFHRDTDKSTYFFAKEEHIFINDLLVSNGQLVYSYWDGMGAHPVATGMPVSQWEGLELRDKQIYYKGKQLTSSPDVKKKPLLINGTFVLYLSDKNRGPGFYTLRKLDL